jgi:heptosyltransferase-2
MPEKILVRGVNWIGDAVMTIPALRALRKDYPGARISLLVKPSVAALFQSDPSIDEVILYEEEFESLIGKLKLSRRIRGEGFSRAILLQNALDAALIAFLAGIPERGGYERDGRGFLLTRPIPFDNEDRKIHHVEYYLNLLKALGIRADYSRPWIHLSLEERLSARARLSQLKRPLLGLNPGAAYGSAKRWLPERFAEVADWFMRDTDGSVVIFGGSTETAIAEAIQKEVGFRNANSSSVSARPVRGQGQGRSPLDTGTEKRYGEPGNSLLNLAGKTSLRELVSLISECEVFLTNDSGPMHVAYAVGTPLAALFGSTDPVLTGPPGEGHEVFKHEFECSPCFERTCRQNDLRCMYSITSDEVYLAIKRLLGDKPAVFLDRDGTLCEDVDYLSKWEDFRILPGVEELVELKGKGYSLMGVTNQSGIARGRVDESFVREVNKVFVERFGFDDFSYCPHLPEENCSCRKPEPGMLFDLRRKHGIDLKKSYVIGDKEIDMMLAKAVGAKGILVRTGKQSESAFADFVADNLLEAVALVNEGGLWTSERRY